MAAGLYLSARRVFVYGPAEVRAQIDAAEAMGVSGWLLWNAAGEFEAEALAPE